MKKILLGGICIAAFLSLSGCTVVAVTTAVAGTAVSVGLAAGSVAVGAATSVVKGVGSVVLDDDDDKKE